MVPPRKPTANVPSHSHPPQGWLWRVLQVLADHRIVVAGVGLGLVTGCAADGGPDYADPKTVPDGAFTVPKDLTGTPDSPVWEGAEGRPAPSEETEPADPPPAQVAAPRGTEESQPDDAQASADHRKIEDPVGPGKGDGRKRGQPGDKGGDDPTPGDSAPKDPVIAPPPVEETCGDDAGCPALANGCIIQTCQIGADGGGKCVATSFICECVPGFDAGCHDGDSCTTDACNDVGACVHGASSICDDGQPCTQDACNNSFCSHVNFASGVACEDGNLCTLAETCKAGVCTVGALADCNDGDPCTFDVCEGSKGCTHKPTDTDACGG